MEIAIILGNGNLIGSMGWAGKSSQMRSTMRGSLLMADHMVRAHCTQTLESMLGNGSWVSSRDRANGGDKQVRPMLGSGRQIKQMDLVGLSMQMAVGMRGNINNSLNMDEVGNSSLMETTTMENMLMVNQKEWGITNGRMDHHIVGYSYLE